MKRVALMKISILLICSVFLFGNGWAQKKSDQLQAEQNKLEKKLSTTKSLLEKVKRGTQNSLSELKLIETQVRDREELVQECGQPNQRCRIDHFFEITRSEIITKESIDLKRTIQTLVDLCIQTPQ